MRLRPGEILAVAAVLALAVAASWPALGVAFDAATASAAAPPSPTTSAPVVSLPPPAVPPSTLTPSVPAPTSSTDGQVRLKVVAPRYAAGTDSTLWKSVASDFHAENPGITVEVEEESTRDAVATYACRW